MRRVAAASTKVLNFFVVPIRFVTDSLLWHFDEVPAPLSATEALTYQLLLFRASSPADLLVQRVAGREFTEALSLASMFGLNADPVYQAMWESSPVTSEAIHGYLDKITDLHWVLQSCLSRVASNPDAMFALLRFGISKLQNAFVIMKELRPFCEEAKRRFTEYLERLDTILDMLKLPKGAIPPMFSIDFAVCFSDFREKNLLELSLGLAEGQHFAALDVVLRRHKRMLSVYLLSILSYIPEAAAPSAYSFLLPISPFTATESAEDAVLHQKLDAGLSSDVRPFSYKRNDVVQWFRLRAIEIDERAGLFENAIELLAGGLERGLRELDVCYSDFLTLRSVSFGLFPSSLSTSIDLTWLKTTDPLTTAVSMVPQAASKAALAMQRDLLPYLLRIQQGRTSQLPIQPAAQLFTAVIRHIASSVGLELPSILLEEVTSRASQYRDLGLTTDDLSKLGAEIIETCGLPGQSHPARRIYESLRRSTTRSPAATQTALPATLQRLDLLIGANELLERRGIPHSPLALSEISKDDEKQRRLLIQFCRTLFRQSGQKDWDVLFDDLVVLGRVLFLDLSPSVIFREFIMALLLAGECGLASYYLSLRNGSAYAFSASELEIIVSTAALEFIDNAEEGSRDNESLRLALDWYGFFLIPVWKAPRSIGV